MWSVPGTLPICTCSGSAKGPRGLGSTWGRGSGYSRELSSLIWSLGTLFACFLERGSDDNQSVWWVVSGFLRGLWAGKGGGDGLPSRLSQPRGDLPQ